MRWLWHLWLTMHQSHQHCLPFNYRYEQEPHKEKKKKKSPRAHVAMLYGLLRLIRSVWESKFLVIKLTEIVILWVYYTIPFGFSLIWHFLGITFHLLNYFVWLRITDEGSVPEMRIWSILLIKFDLKWCIHLSRSLFLYSFEVLF